MKPIKLFRRCIGFSFWHHFGKPFGTGIQWRRWKNGLIGVDTVRADSPSVRIGLWWNWEISLVSIHPNAFHK
jgi:hypothetical protein